MVTNGLLMNREWSRNLVRMNVSKISISLDGATKETYEKIRKGGDFDKVIKPRLVPKRDANGEIIEDEWVETFLN